MSIAQFAAGKRPASLDTNEAHLPTKRRGEDEMTLSTAFQASPRLGFDDCGLVGRVAASSVTFWRGGAVLRDKMDPVKRNQRQLRRGVPITTTASVLQGGVASAAQSQPVRMSRTEWRRGERRALCRRCWGDGASPKKRL